MCILGREIVSRLTGECRPVFRPTDEWSGRLSYIHNPQALGIIIIIIIIIFASSWLSSPSELCSSSYSINCHWTPNPRCFLAYRPTISTHKIVTVKTKIPKSKIFIDSWFYLFFCPFSPFCPNVPCPPFLEPKPLLTDYRTTAIFIIITTIIIIIFSSPKRPRPECPHHHRRDALRAVRAVLPLVMDDRANIVISGGSKDGGSADGWWTIRSQSGLD